MFLTAKDETRALLLSICVSGGYQAGFAEDDVEELGQLAEAAGYDGLIAHVARVRRPKAATLLGMGVIETTRRLADRVDAQTIIVGGELTAVQERNLEKIWERPVLDRDGLILNIFARRATTHESKLQVELAQSERQRSRLAGLWTHLERQRGGIGVRGGPGEKQIEIDRRLLSQKIRVLKGKIRKLDASGGLARVRRRKNGVMTVAIVGYTNAGKTTLFKCLTKSAVSPRGRIFDTLESKARSVYLSGNKHLVLSDTVGFIRNLPHELVAGFSTTLREAADSDLLLIVADASRADFEEQRSVVAETLHNIGAANVPGIMVINKIDLQSDVAKRAAFDAANGKMATVSLSCKTGEGIETLRQMLSARIPAVDNHV